ncbi:flagellar basal body-associated FliL family protein [Clostridium weizhouense]|uniref:Flagellar protein FliL n=1 Tax=Clostridium weizhouense TaxID=2859781 RepID=A0ABS7AIQ8_9CLOT|nr:flagellar basal body-associated FliL family protein [Clostridium weizhouense]MBW6408550.1 flagellar basal body-associated FliL family protein [Clostridium weizhouense]
MANKEKDTKEGKGGGMKKIIIFVLALVLVGGGVFAGTYMFMQKNNQVAVKEKPIECVYVDLGEMTVNLADEGGKRYFKGKISVGYDVSDKDAPTEMEAKKVVIRDTTIFYLKALKLEFMNDPKNEQKIKTELMDKINKQLAKCKVVDIRFDSIITQ